MKLVHLVGFIIKKFVTMHRHMNVKKSAVQFFKLTHTRARARTHTHAQVLSRSLDLRPQQHRKSPVSVITQLSESCSFGFFFSVAHSPPRALAVSLLRFLYRTISSKTWYDSSERVISSFQGSLPTQRNKHKRRTSVPSAEFEPAIPAIKWLQTCEIDRPTTGIECSGLLY
jgi:hypothetical protein